MPLGPNFINQIEKLTGQNVPFEGKKDVIGSIDPFSKGGIGYSQLNEILLTLGYDRVTREFFDYIFSSNPYPGDPTPSQQISTMDQLFRGVQKHRIHSLLIYGNIKFGFKTLSRLDSKGLREALCNVLPIQRTFYEQRHPPLHSLSEIPGEETYYLGYLVYKQIKEALEKTPDDSGLLKKHSEILETRQKGRNNHDVYLTYDHMDVYVATSMRERHEYYLVNGFVKTLFNHPDLVSLKLRYFDPTQAYCEDRLDKGLVEGLMLKRAKCTIYHAQETDTFGKDSELATTLAQGKPVIAYVPRPLHQDEFIQGALILAERLYPELSRKEHLKKLLRLYDPEAAWQNDQIRNWLSGAAPFDEKRLSEIVFKKAQETYDKRAMMLSKDHPLGLQMNLDTGVANGVLVVRTVNDCAALLRRIMLSEMEFTLEEAKVDEKVTILLREKISGCVYRAMTGDELLTNSFWNFYLKEGPCQDSLHHSYHPSTQLNLDLLE
jgi:hypothetical protein